MAQGSETALVGKMMKAIKAEFPPAWVTKVHGGPYQAAGIPDLLVCVEGRLVGIEAKFPRPGESREASERRVTPRQQHALAALRAAGGVAGSATTVEEALALVREAIQNNV